MSWDIQRRDGRTEIPCDEIVTVKGRLLSEDQKQLVIQTDTERILVRKGTFEFDVLDKNERYYILARTNKDYKLIDYV